MAEITITDATDYKPGLSVDDRGRVTIGSEYAGETVNVVVETQDNE